MANAGFGYAASALAALGDYADSVLYSELSAGLTNYMFNTALNSRNSMYYANGWIDFTPPGANVPAGAAASCDGAGLAANPEHTRGISQGYVNTGYSASAKAHNDRIMNQVLGKAGTNLPTGITPVNDYLRSIDSNPNCNKQIDVNCGYYVLLVPGTNYAIDPLNTTKFAGFMTGAGGMYTWPRARLSGPASNANQ